METGQPKRAIETGNGAGDLRACLAGRVGL